MTCSILFYLVVVRNIIVLERSGPSACMVCVSAIICLYENSISYRPGSAQLVNSQSDFTFIKVSMNANDYQIRQLAVCRRKTTKFIRGRWKIVVANDRRN